MTTIIVNKAGIATVTPAFVAGCKARNTVDDAAEFARTKAVAAGTTVVGAACSAASFVGDKAVDVANNVVDFTRGFFA